MKKKKYTIKQAFKPTLITSRENEIVCMCDCGGADHLLKINKWQEGKAIEYFFSIVPVHKSLWYRIKDAWHLIWQGPHIDEVILGHIEVKKLIDALLGSIEKVTGDK